MRAKPDGDRRGGGSRAGTRRVICFSDARQPAIIGRLERRGRLWQVGETFSPRANSDERQREARRLISSCMLMEGARATLSRARACAALAARHRARVKRSRRPQAYL